MFAFFVFQVDFVCLFLILFLVFDWYLIFTVVLVLWYCVFVKCSLFLLFVFRSDVGYVFFVLELVFCFGSVVFNMVVFVFVLCCSKLCFPCS